MIHALVFACVLLQASQAAPAPAASPQAQPQHVSEQATPVVDLLKVKRIYVDSFGEDPASREMQSNIVSVLVAGKHFIVTEVRERADAILKGVALEKSTHEVHAFGESTVAGRSAISDSSLNTETIDRAQVSLRLINREGDLIWTTTQESKGAKYKGASADAADMCVKQLLRDIAKLQPANTPQQPTTPATGNATHP